MISYSINPIFGESYLSIYIDWARRLAVKHIFEDQQVAIVFIGQKYLFITEIEQLPFIIHIKQALR